MTTNVKQTKTNTNLVKMTKAQQEVFDGLTTTSMRIRYLDSIGWSRTTIAGHLNKRYQHVRNVLVSDEQLGKTYEF